MDTGATTSSFNDELLDGVGGHSDDDDYDYDSSQNEEANSDIEDDN
jgi:hypothetical protein